MIERAKLFEALMRHLWSYWLRLPPTKESFYGPELFRDMTHLEHAQTLIQLMWLNEHEAVNVADLRRREKEMLLGPELPPSACSKTDD